MKKPLVLALTLTATPLLAQEAPKATPELLAKGKQAFNVNCSVCHGATGKGDGIGAAALNPKPRDFTKDPFKNGNKPENIFKTLQTGIPGTTMVAFAHLPETDRWALAHYVVTLTPAGSAAPTEAKDGGQAGAKPSKKKQ